ncbi:aliphatic nitrilase [Fusarium austroafricanum]|uniref:Aliphatic nitrilase n=1 Tax=Fusarium austroafricanum TaxID=2364996 RepID=A0A8H4JYY5_9HYPO|nr:aliphatic nitrilase [Fusarium austroafricanum]
MNMIRVAACHVSPIFLSAKDTTSKAISLIQQAAQNKANLVVFPETYISAFPIWSSLRPPTENHEIFKQMAKESIFADGDEIHAIRSTAKQEKVMVSVGFSEKTRFSSATLFNSNVFIGDKGDVLIHHRKLMPTFFEKLTWAPGDGHGLRVADTTYGKIGNLICGENTNPLARYSLMAQGENIHISTWPPIWPTRVSPLEESEEATTTDNPNYDNVTANRTRAAAHCFEAKCFGVLCSSILGDDAIQTIAGGSPYLAKVLEHSQRGATQFLDPTGAPLKGFTIDSQTGEAVATELLQHEEGILYADLDIDDCIEGKQYHDVVGGYQRLDVFDLKVNRTRREPVTFTEGVDDESSKEWKSLD